MFARTRHRNRFIRMEAVSLENDVTKIQFDFPL